MASIRFEREGPAGPRLVALLGEVELKRIMGADQASPSSPGEVNLFSNDELREALADADLRETVALGKTLRRGGPFSRKLGTSLLAAVSLMHQREDYPVDLVLEGKGILPQDVGEIEESLDRIRKVNGRVGMSGGAGRGFWDPFEFLRTHLVLRRERGGDGDVTGMPAASGGALRVGPGVAKMGTAADILNKMCSAASLDGLPVGVNVVASADGVVEWAYSGVFRKLSGVESLAADGGVLFIKARNAATNVLEYSAVERRGGGSPERFPVSEEEIAERSGRVSEFFGMIPKKGGRRRR